MHNEHGESTRRHMAGIFIKTTAQTLSTDERDDEVIRTTDKIGNDYANFQHTL